MKVIHPWSSRIRIFSPCLIRARDCARLDFIEGKIMDLQSPRRIVSTAEGISLRLVSRDGVLASP
jgi:hypothetical protein